MKSWSIKSVFTLSFVFILLLTSFPGQAKREEERNIPLEGEFDNIGARSITPQKTVDAILSGANVNIKFYVYVPYVTINIKNADQTVIYTNTISAPQCETISLKGFESGCYTLEIDADNGSMYGTFMYVFNDDI